MNGIQKTMLASLMLLGQNSSAISLKEQWNSFKKDNQHVSLVKAAITGYVAYVAGYEAYRIITYYSKGGMEEVVAKVGLGGVTAFMCYENSVQTIKDLNKGMDNATIPELPSTKTLTNKWSELGGKSRLAAGSKAICSGLAAIIGSIAFVGGCNRIFKKRNLHAAVVAGLFADTTLRLGTQTWQDARLALTGTTSHSEESEDGPEQVPAEVA